MDLWTVLLAWGALQGVALAAALLLRQPRRGPGDRLLAALVLAFSLPLAEHCFIRQGLVLVDSHHTLVFLTTPALFLPGPLFYAYARALRSGQPARREIGWHLIPAAAMAINYAPAYIALLERALGVAPGVGPVPGQIVWVNGYVAWGAEILQLATYLVLSRPVLRGLEAAVRDHVSRSSATQVEWLRHLALVLLCVALVNVVALIGMVTVRHVVELEYAMGLAYALGVHFVGFVSVRDPRVFGWHAAEPAAEPAAVDRHRASAERSETPDGAGAERSARYVKSGLTPERRRLYRDRLVQLMERETPWLDENLGLGDLARQAAIPPAHVSEVLSQELETSFFGFVNAYRVHEAQRLLGAADATDRSVLEIAMACGFSSKSSFNRVFKRLTRMTPSAFAHRARRAEATSIDRPFEEADRATPSPRPADRLGRRKPPPAATWH